MCNLKGSPNNVSICAHSNKSICVILSVVIFILFSYTSTAQMQSKISLITCSFVFYSLVVLLFTKYFYNARKTVVKELKSSLQNISDTSHYLGSVKVFHFCENQCFRTAPL